jgi:hypothetical protein
MFFYKFYSTNPSFAFLWLFLSDLIYFYKEDKVDKAFDSIVREAAEEVEDDEEINVAVVENKAYWVIQNIFYQADIVNGEIDKTSSKPIDAFDMSNGDIRKMLFILDHLAEG